MGLVSLENLVKLETNRQPAYMDDIHLAHAPIPTTCWQRLRRGAWLMVSDPTSSVKAKVCVCVWGGVGVCMALFVGTYTWIYTSLRS